ncbi:MAG: histone deacetylase [Gemmatimonadales bacterium]|nr:MAG: histone deacetylase [Gemmatimonadales bacterium]
MAFPYPLIWAPEYEVDIGIHVYPTRKYRLLRELLLSEGVAAPGDFRRPRPAERTELLRVHTPTWVEKALTGELTTREVMTLELPWSQALRDAVVLCCGGTLEAAKLALEEGVACHLGGGFHHAFADHGEGFCLLNDVAVAAAAMVEGGLVSRLAVVDLDVHHGNGTAHIFRDTPGIMTFSMHARDNYPAVKPPGDLDLALAPGTGDDEYLELLEEHLPRVLAGLGGPPPELVIYLAGVDPFRDDQLGGLGLSEGGLRTRDRCVFQRCRESGIGVAVVLAGGYARREEDTVRLHRNTILEAARVRPDATTHGL